MGLSILNDEFWIKIVKLGEKQESCWIFFNMMSIKWIDMLLSNSQPYNYIFITTNFPFIPKVHHLLECLNTYGFIECNHLLCPQGMRSRTIPPPLHHHENKICGSKVPLNTAQNGVYKGPSLSGVPLLRTQPTSVILLIPIYDQNLLQYKKMLVSSLDLGIQQYFIKFYILLIVTFFGFVFKLEHNCFTILCCFPHTST